MLKIGIFSKLSRVSIRMLRYYDEIGLLKPAEIDSFTDYRYYREDQLPIVCQIAALRDMGFSLAEVCEIMKIYGNHEKLDTYLIMRQKELEMLSAKTTQQLRLLDTARKRLRKEGIMNYNIIVKTLSERYAACVRMTIPHYEDEGRVWNVLCAETDAMNLIPDDPCYCAVVFHDGEYKEKNVDVEAQKTVKGRYHDTEHVHFKTLPSVKVASCTFQGGYEQIVDVYAAVVAWLDANGYVYNGPMFNIYHISPHETKNPDEYVTEVCYPIKEK